VALVGPAEEPTGDRVLRIATALFAERGYDATGVQELSEATGLGRGALYYHIKSKQGLLQRIALGLLERANQNAATIVALEAPVTERLAALTENLLEDLSEHRDAWIISMRDWQALDAEPRARVSALRDQYEQTWQRLLDEGAAEGSWRAVEPVLRRAIIGMFTSSYRWIEPTGPMTPREISRRYLEFILHGLVSQERAETHRG
jgi:AcrR family transcriptional regulator